MADWQTALETVAAAYARGTLEKDARTISEAYRLKTGYGRRLLTRKSEAAAYALSRMPATVEAAKAALTEALAGWLCRRKGIDPSDAALIPMEEYRRQQFDILAAGVRGALDMDAVYAAMGMEKR